MQDARHLVFNTLVDRQPVEFAQGWRDVVTHAQSNDDPGSIVLGNLKITQRSSSLSSQLTAVFARARACLLNESRSP